MSFRLERGEHVARDLEALFNFLFGTYLQFGDDDATAYERAAERVEAVDATISSLLRIPHQGTRREDLLPGLRSVTKDRAILYFTVDDDAQTVRVLAVFFGGQDHQLLMLKRLMTKR